ncbi:MAG: NUDIX hydrolase [Bacillota bacterium]|nr:NUDIX hydrolase [Bacillota bacterium]
MLFRSCAGGVVFHGDDVFLLQNEKDEWVLPKGAIREGFLSAEVALRRIQEEAGIEAEIITTAGETSYEFYSITRKAPVCNEITWYLMTAKDGEYAVNKREGFKDGGYFGFEEALKLITYSQDKALVSIAYKKLKQALTQKTKH